MFCCESSRVVVVLVSPLACTVRPEACHINRACLQLRYSISPVERGIFMLENTSESSTSCFCVKWMVAACNLGSLVTILSNEEDDKPLEPTISSDYTLSTIVIPAENLRRNVIRLQKRSSNTVYPYDDKQGNPFNKMMVDPKARRPAFRAGDRSTIYVAKC